MAAPLVSVIVAARDEEESLPALLGSLGEQTMAPGDVEVIVVDNGSRDRTADVATGLGARVVSEPRLGRARARNLAVAQSRAELLAFTDADCIVRADWLEQLTGCLGRAPLVGGTVRVTTSAEPRTLEHLEVAWRFRQEVSVRTERWSVTANLGMRRVAFLAIGGFDSGFRYIGEDVDLCLRAARAGYEIVWCPEAVVDHPAETRIWPTLRRAAAQAHSERQLRLVHGREGGGQWRHPGPLVRGDWALRRFEVDPAALGPGLRRRMLRLARLEYAGRMAGSAWAGVALSRPGRALSSAWRRSSPAG